MKKFLTIIILLFSFTLTYGQDAALLKKAESGDVNAQYNLWKQYKKLKKEEEGLKWFIKAAENGHGGAQYWLSVGYKNGWYGLSENPDQSIYWLKKAANNERIKDCDEEEKNSIADAQCSLGLDYDMGRYLEENLTEAIKWYKKAAFNGSDMAAFSLGLIYQYRMEDTQEAIYWYKKSMDIVWESENEEKETAFKKLRELGVTYHPGDHVGHNHSVSSSTSSSVQTSTQSQGNKVQQYTETVPVQVWQACGGCNGTGQCQVCFGSGWTLSSTTYNGKRTCIACHGSGKCTSCAGNGGQNVVRYEQRTVYR